MISPLKVAAEAEAKRFCGNCWTFKQGKHLKMVLTGPSGRRGTVVISKSPSCPFASKKVARDVRHVMRGIGYAVQ